MTIAIHATTEADIVSRVLYTDAYVQSVQPQRKATTSRVLDPQASTALNDWWYHWHCARLSHNKCIHKLSTVARSTIRSGGLTGTHLSQGPGTRDSLRPPVDTTMLRALGRRTRGASGRHNRPPSPTASTASPDGLPCLYLGVCGFSSNATSTTSLVKRAFRKTAGRSKIPALLRTDGGVVQLLRVAKPERRSQRGRSAE